VADDAHLAEYEHARFAWPTDPQGFHNTQGDLKIRPRDMARFGQLFLQTGQWNGRQLVPATWVQQATSPQAGPAFPSISSGNFQPTNYGYLWWVTTVDHVPAYFALGYGGQLIEVVPQRQLVLVISTAFDLKSGAAPFGAQDVQRLAKAIIAAVGVPASS
jgi:CubicO group peptidase (beta-lactamase class C family)